MSSVEESTILNSDPDPSAESGQREGRINRRAVVVFGAAFALVASIGVGVVMARTQHHHTLFAARADAALSHPKPANYTTEQQQTDNREAQAAAEKAAAAKAAAAKASDPNGSTSGDASSGTSPAPSNPNGSSGYGGSASPTSAPSVWDREYQISQDAQVADYARDVELRRAAIDGGIDAGNATSSAAAGSLRSEVQPTMPAAPPTPPPMPTDPPFSSAPNSEGPSADPSPTPAIAFPFAFREGDSADALLIPNADSDRPGEIRFVLSSDITDSDNGALLLIPRGTIGVATVGSVSLGQRALVITPKKILLRGRWIAFPGNTLDKDGNNGVIGHKNTHTWSNLLLTFAAGALSGLSSAVNGSSGVTIYNASSRPPVSQEMAGGAGTAVLNRLNDLAQSQQQPVTISVSRATSVKVQALSDIHLPPYCMPEHPDSRECEALKYLQDLQSEGYTP